LTGLNGNPLNILAPGTSQNIGGGPVFNSIKVKIKPGNFSERVDTGTTV
jgi:hypothetical protein